MSYGLVICGECKREIHQSREDWYHCEDKSPRCNGAGTLYANAVEEIVGKFCGADDMDGKFPKQSSHQDREVQFRREQKKRRTLVIGGLMPNLVNVPYHLRPPRLRPQKQRSGVRIGDMIRLCPGGHHAWYESNVGPVRKPLGAR